MYNEECLYIKNFINTVVIDDFIMLKTKYGKWKQYCKKEINRSFYGFWWSLGYLSGVVINHWKQTKHGSTTRNSQKFRRELQELLTSKLKKMHDLTIPNYVFNKLNSEMYKLLACSLTSNRTPDEIIHEIQHNIEIREEVVNLLLSETGITTFREEQRKFLNRVLSGDNDLKILLNKQKEKKGFPYNI